MCSSTVAGPVIHVTVPEASRPAISSITVPSAATRTSGAGALIWSGPNVEALHGLAGEGHLLAGQQRHQHLQVLAHVAGRLLERQPEHVLDDHLVGQPDAQGQASAAGRLDGKGLGGQHHRVAGVGRARRRCRSPIDGHLPGDRGQGGQGVVGEDLGRPRHLDPGRRPGRPPGPPRRRRASRCRTSRRCASVPRFSVAAAPRRRGRGRHTGGHGRSRPHRTGRRPEAARRDGRHADVTARRSGRIRTMSVAILMGSSSDASVMDDAVQLLRSFDVPVEIRVLSAHRTPDDTVAFARGGGGTRRQGDHRRRRRRRPPGRRGGRHHAAARHRRAHRPGQPAGASTRCWPWSRCRRGSRWPPWPSTGPGTPPCWPSASWRSSDPRLASELDNYIANLAEQVRDMDAESSRYRPLKSRTGLARRGRWSTLDIGTTVTYTRTSVLRSPGPRPGRPHATVPDPSA